MSNAIHRKPYVDLRPGTWLLARQRIEVPDGTEDEPWRTRELDHQIPMRVEYVRDSGRTVCVRTLNGFMHRFGPWMRIHALNVGRVHLVKRGSDLLTGVRDGDRIVYHHDAMPEPIVFDLRCED